MIGRRATFVVVVVIIIIVIVVVVSAGSSRSNRCDGIGRSGRGRRDDTGGSGRAGRRRRRRSSRPVGRTLDDFVFRFRRPGAWTWFGPFNFHFETWFNRCGMLDGRSGGHFARSTVTILGRSTSVIGRNCCCGCSSSSSSSSTFDNNGLLLSR